MDAAILFDFGGTLDADGLTWKERFFRLCLDEGLTVSRERFDPVFYGADDALVGGIPDTTSIEDTVGRLATGVVGALRPDDAGLARGRRGPIPRCGARLRSSATGRCSRACLHAMLSESCRTSWQSPGRVC